MDVEPGVQLQTISHADAISIGDHSYLLDLVPLLLDALQLPLLFALDLGHSPNEIQG